MLLLLLLTPNKIRLSYAAAATAADAEKCPQENSAAASRPIFENEYLTQFDAICKILGNGGSTSFANFCNASTIEIQQNICDKRQVQNVCKLLIKLVGENLSKRLIFADSFTEFYRRKFQIIAGGQ